jgi:hypothetical protein
VRQSANGAGAGIDDEPRLRRLVVALVVVEVVLLVGVACFLAVEAVVAESGDPTATAALAVLVLVFGVGLGVCARGVASVRQWSRAPTLTWQLMQASVALPTSASAFWFLGVPLLAVSVLVVVLIIRPGVIPPR